MIMNFDIFIFVVRFCKYLIKKDFLEKSDTHNLQNLVIYFTPETLCPYTEWQPTGNRTPTVIGFLAVRHLRCLPR